jgi:hypothetical protein
MADSLYEQLPYIYSPIDLRTTFYLKSFRMQRLFKTLVVLFSLIALSQKASATHAAGGELVWPDRGYPTELVL